MRLVLIRHGVAADAGPETQWRDPPRALTDEGRAKMLAAAMGIAALGLEVDALLTSPLVRCRQTAEIVGASLGLEPRSVGPLGPGCSVDDLIGILMAFPLDSSVMVCGHQPDLSVISAELIAGGDLEFKKGALAVIDLDVPRARAGILRALYPPAALRALGGA